MERKTETDRQRKQRYKGREREKERDRERKRERIRRLARNLENVSIPRSTAAPSDILLLDRI